MKAVATIVASAWGPYIVLCHSSHNACSSCGGDAIVDIGDGQNITDNFVVEDDITGVCDLMIRNEVWLNLKQLYVAYY